MADRSADDDDRRKAADGGRDSNRPDYWTVSRWAGPCPAAAAVAVAAKAFQSADGGRHPSYIPQHKVSLFEVLSLNYSSQEENIWSLVHVVTLIPSRNRPRGRIEIIFFKFVFNSLFLSADDVHSLNYQPIT